MRAKERIPIIINFFRLVNQQAFKEFISPLKINKTPRALLNKQFEDYWIENPDQRLGQLLINQGIIENDFGLWIQEESEWLVEKGYFKFEDINFWGNNYDKDNNKLPETKYILLKDITDDHIKGILEFFKDREYQLRSQYLEYFKSRLNIE